jgi:hypothetical protein
LVAWARSCADSSSGRLTFTKTPPDASAGSLQSRRSRPNTRTVTAEFHIFDHGERSALAVVSDDLGCFYHPLKAGGWDIAQMGQDKDNGCCYATTAHLLDWFRNKGGNVDGTQIQTEVSRQSGDA